MVDIVPLEGTKWLLIRSYSHRRVRANVFGTAFLGGIPMNARIFRMNGRTIVKQYRARRQPV